MDIPANNSKKDKKAKAVDAVIDPNVVLGDPLASPPLDPTATAAPAADDATTDSASDDQTNAADPTQVDDGSIVPNDTVTTNDSSAVGEFKPTPPPEPPQEDLVAPESIIDPSLRPSANPLGIPDAEPDPADSAPQPAADPVTPTVNDAKPADDATAAADITIPTITTPAPEPEDPEKTKFIKTYTAEYEEAMHRATDTVQKILDAIDTTINEHAPDIKIPEEANEFLEKKPAEGKVEKFEDAREIIRTIMAHATESKEQSEAAAAEASKVYDEVQQFKRDTKQQIADLTDEK